MPDSIAFATGVDNLNTCGEGANIESPNIESSAISVAIASNCSTASHAHDTLQPQEPSSYAAHPSTTSLDGITESQGTLEMATPATGSLSPFGLEMATPATESISADPTRTHLPQPQRTSSNAVHPSTTSLDSLTLNPQRAAVAVALPAFELIPTDSGKSHVPQPQGTSSKAVHPFMTPPGRFLPLAVATPAAILSLSTDIPESSTWISVGISKSMQSLPNVPRSSSATLQPSSTKKRSNLPTPNTEVVPAPSFSTQLSSLSIDAKFGLISSTRTSTADFNSQYIFPSSNTLNLDSTATFGFDTHTRAQDLPISINQVLHDSSSTASFLFRPTATPSVSKQPSPLTISGQTLTANSLGQYFIDDQTLTPGGVITVSGSKVSLAPNASDLIIGTSTEALAPSVIAHLGSGSNGTEVQKFTGNALGTSDGLWSSSMMLLVSFLLLLWI